MKYNHRKHRAKQKEEKKMDIQKVILEVVSKLTGNSDLIKKFTVDPAAIIKQLTGFIANADQLKEIVAGVSKALGIDAGKALEQGKGLLAKLKSLFGK